MSDLEPPSAEDLDKGTLSPNDSYARLSIGMSEVLRRAEEDRARAEVAVREREARLDILNETNTLLLATEEPEAVIQAIAEKAARNLRADVFFNYVLDEGAARLRLNASGGVDERVAKMIEHLELGQAICGCVARDGERIISEDVQNNGDPRADLVRRMGVRSYVCHPLFVNGKSVGTLSFGTKRKDAFTPQEIELMKSMAAQVSVALERSRRERALQESQARVEEMIRHAPAGIYEITFDPPRFVRVNEVASTLAGYSREELLAMSPFDVLDEESGQHLRERMAKMIAGESVPAEVEYRMVRKDGSTIFVVLNSTIMRDESGHPYSAFIIGHDVTVRRRSEDALARSLGAARDLAQREETLKSVTETASSLLPPAELATRISEAAARLFGAKQAQIRLASEDGQWLLAGGVYDPSGYLQSVGDIHVDANTETAATFRLGMPRMGEDITALVSEESGHNADSAGIRSYVLLPVFAGERRIGVFYMGWGQSRTFSGEDLSFMKAVTRQFSIGLQNALLYESQQKRRRRIEALHDVVKVAVISLDVHGAAQRILDHLSQHYDFDLSSIWLDAGGFLERVSQVGYPDAYPKTISLAENYDAIRVFLSGERMVVRHPSNEHVLQAYRDLDIDLDSYVALPLRARGSCIGVLMLAWTKQHELNDYDLAFFDSVADEIAVVLENSRLYEVEHSIAETLQETLVALPSQLPGVEYARAYESATYQMGRVGGDFVDLFEIKPHVVGVVIGDVSGKGMQAAVVTSLVRNTVRAHALDGLAPDRVVEKTNNVVRRFTDVDVYVTMFFGLLNTETGLLRYVSAGHPPALVVAEDSIESLPACDPIVGAFDSAEFHASSAILRPSDRLVLYTDGVTEAKSPADARFLDLDGLISALAESASLETSDLASTVMEQVVAFSDGVLRDDAAILVVHPTQLSAPSTDAR